LKLEVIQESLGFCSKGQIDFVSSSLFGLVGARDNWIALKIL
jgi:hypothetical protein